MNTGLLSFFSSHPEKPGSPPASHHPSTSPSPSPAPSPAPLAGKPMPYDTPDPSGKNWLLELPEEVLHVIFLYLNLGDLTRCFRLCKPLHAFLTESAAINLRHTLMANSLRLNPYATIANPDIPHQMPLTSAKMLAHLRETLTRFRNVAPKSTSRVTFREPSGTLYEYLEGVLLRTARGPTAHAKSNKLHVYDLRRVDEWEDTEDIAVDDDDEVFETASDSPMEGDFKTEHTFDFKICEVATDPTQDLLIVVSMTPVTEPGQGGRTEYRMEFHLLALSTFEPHPKAEQHIIEFPVLLRSRSIMLDFQICDDGLYVMSKGVGPFDHQGLPDLLHGWQWTTGRRHVSLEAPEHVSFESFVLLTPWSFCIPTCVSRLPDGELTPENIRDLFWTSHLYLYAFPPLNDVPEAGGAWTATHVSTVDMPPFQNDILRGVPPMQMMIRTDPPPRHYNSPYPLHAPPPFLPDPESGVAIINFALQQNIFPMRNPSLDFSSMFTLIVHKKTLIKHLPEPTSPLLKQTFSRPVPVVSWSKLAPNSRLLGPDRVPTGWVCYVYQNRYVAPYVRVIGRLERERDGSEAEDEDDDDEDPEVIDLKLQVFDFDERRARKEKLERARRLPPSVDAGDGKVKDKALEGDVDGIELVLSETVIQPVECLFDEPVVTGRNMPYILVEKETDSMNPLIDGQRILQLFPRRRRAALNEDTDDDSDDSDSDDEGEDGMIQIMEF